MFIRSGTPALVLAPMDGVTDHLMREVLTTIAPFAYCVTEFVRVSGVVASDKLLLTSVPELTAGSRTVLGVPIQTQLLGGDPDRLAASAQRAVQLGALGIDLNFGCPAPTVNRHDGGATLLKYPDRIEAIVSAVRCAVPRDLPVSAKLRLGWDSMDPIHENAQRAARGGASWITIHGRTRVQGYIPPAYWGPIGEVRRALDIPVVANGEIWSADDLRRCRDETGCEHFMLGRGALAEPGVVLMCARELGIEVARPSISSVGNDVARWRELLEMVVSRSQSNGESERRTLSRLKQWLNYAHKGGTILWFDQVKRVPSVTELFILLDQMADEALSRRAA